MLCPAFPRLPGVVGARFNERLAALSAAVRSWKAATWKPEAEHHQGQVPCHFGGSVWWEYVARAPNHDGAMWKLLFGIEHWGQIIWTTFFDTEKNNLFHCSWSVALVLLSHFSLFCFMLGIILDPRALHAGVHFQEGGSAGRTVLAWWAVNILSCCHICCQVIQIFFAYDAIKFLGNAIWCWTMWSDPSWDLGSCWSTHSLRLII